MEYHQAERLVKQYGQTIFRLAYARTGSREDAEDITQETFLRLVRANPTFQDEAHCRAWLLRVAANCAADLFRAPWRGKNRPLEEAEHVAAREPEPEAMEMLEAVLALPEDYRIPVHLFYYEGMSVAEIARTLGKREGAVRTRLSRARTMLRDRLREEEQHV